MERAFVLRLSALASLVGLLSATDAHAACRTTTCNLKKEPNTCAVDENECESTGTPLQWKSSCVRLNVNRRGTSQLVFEDAKAVILRAFNTWQTVTCPGGGTPSMNFTVGEDAYTEDYEFKPSQPNINLIVFLDNSFPQTTTEHTLATTKVAFDPANGAIWHSSMIINSAGTTFSISKTPKQAPGKQFIDVESVIVHEAGHFIGIAHSNDERSVMYKNNSNGEFKRDLQADDILAVCNAYPPGRVAPCNDEPKNGFGDRDDPNVPTGPCIASLAPATHGSGAFAGAVALGLAALTRHRKRTRTR
jgi:hypothetical protein